MLMRVSSKFTSWYFSASWNCLCWDPPNCQFCCSLVILTGFLCWIHSHLSMGSATMFNLVWFHLFRSAFSADGTAVVSQVLLLDHALHVGEKPCSILRRYKFWISCVSGQGKEIWQYHCWAAAGFYCLLMVLANFGWLSLLESSCWSYVPLSNNVCFRSVAFPSWIYAVPNVERPLVSTARLLPATGWTAVTCCSLVGAKAGTAESGFSAWRAP